MSKANTTVFVSGNFFALHPGHVRLLRFAADCGDRLVVGVHSTTPTPGVPTPEERAEALKELGIVNDVVILRNGLEAYIRAERPNIVVKGKEFESQKNVEQPIVAAYGGRLLFSSGETSYSGADLLSHDHRAAERIPFDVPHDYLKHHAISGDGTRSRIDSMSRLSVVVVGDLIVDEYIHCEPLGMSREDPTLVVSPYKTERFVGGAGIVAAHAAALGATVSFISVVGADSVGQDAAARLKAYGVETRLITDDSRPTTLKQRYRAHDKTMLRVSHLRQHELAQSLQNQLLGAGEDALARANLIIFSDFNYGCLPQSVVDRLTSVAALKGAMIAADSQSSSQVGDISRFKNTRLLTATEHEARMALRDQSSGLATLGFRLLTAANAGSAFIKLGAAGVLIVSSPAMANAVGLEDRIPALNPYPRDVSGAGDSMLTGAAMALAAGASTWEAAYIGALAAARQTARIGNIPVHAAELKASIAP